MKLLALVFFLSLEALASFTGKDHLIISSEKKENVTNNLMHEMEISAFTQFVDISASFINKLGSSESAPFFLEKKYISHEQKNFKISLGDTHEELGRGIALSLFSNPTFGIDNTIEGLSAHYFDDQFNAKIFGGRINSLDYPVSIYSETNPLINRNVYLIAGEISHPLFNTFSMGEHYFIAHEKTHTEKRFQTVGIFISREGILNPINGYIELNILFINNLVNSYITYPNGYGTYGALNFFTGAFQFDLEFKDYRNYYFDFRRPPTLEDDIVDSINTEDITAMRLSSFYKTKSEIFKLSFLGGQDRTKEAPIYHIIGETKLDLSSPIEIKIGYRWYPEKLTLYHGSIGTKIKTFKAQSIEFKFLKQVKNLNSIDFVSLREDRNKLETTYNFSHKFNISSGLEFIPTNPQETGNLYMNLGFSVNLSSLTAKAFIGKTSGGTVCAGGVCRIVPTYSGGMIETIYQF